MRTMAHMIAAEADVDKESMRECVLSVRSEPASRPASGRRACSNGCWPQRMLECEPDFIRRSSALYYVDEFPEPPSSRGSAAHPRSIAYENNTPGCGGSPVAFTAFGKRSHVQQGCAGITAVSKGSRRRGGLVYARQYPHTQTLVSGHIGQEHP